MTRLGILGGGQLAQMLTQAAISLGIETVIFERTPDTPAARLTHHQVVGQWEDEVTLSQFASLCDLVTLENEFVDSSVLRHLEARGLSVYPSATTLAAVQDKLLQKQCMQAAGIPVPAFCEANTPEDIQHAASKLGYPLILKARRDGYDGYGNATLNSPDDIMPEWERLSKNGRKLLIEQYIPFARELAVMVVRGRDSKIRSYPVVETVQENHICHIVRAPAPLSSEIAERARILAEQAVVAIDGVGVFGVELFLLANGDIVYNEIAPRPHNSGHYTIEACVTSQFENHLRAVLDWPLGDTSMRSPAAVMVNLLGKRNGEAQHDGIKAALHVPGAHLHLYGKRQVRVGRKMGHITVLANSREEAEMLACQAADLVNL